MKIIELLNKIANGEEVPKKILYKDEIYTYDEEEKDYLPEGYDLYCLFAYALNEKLNDEVKILETTITYNRDKKIEKLNIVQEKNFKNNWKWKCNGYNISTPQKIMVDKINEIIDKLNGE